MTQYMNTEDIWLCSDCGLECLSALYFEYKAATCGCGHPDAHPPCGSCESHDCPRCGGEFVLQVIDAQASIVEDYDRAMKSLF